MRFSVVICTFNRAPSLRLTLDALRHQTHSDFEVVVVNGPSGDGTSELLAERSEDLRVVETPLRRLGVSRNLGIAAAAADVVAFIDDDAVPEPRWLEDLNAAYDDPVVGGVGGLTLNATGVHPQYRYSVCSRFGETDFDQRPPLDPFNQAGADPFLYLQGTNCSFRRSVLAKVGGFDEDIVSVYDEAEVCSRVLDAGHELRALDVGVVHHHSLPSHVRDAAGLTDPSLLVRDHTHFALRVGRAYGSRADILGSVASFVERLKNSAADEREAGRMTWAAFDRFRARADEGFALGLQTGLASTRRGCAIPDSDPEAFRAYPVRSPSGPRLAVCLISVDYPPRPLGGIARYTQDLARGLAAAGHEAHVVTRGEDLLERTAMEDGVWVHRIPVAERCIPELHGHPLKATFDHLAAVRGAVQRIAKRAPLDVIAGSTWMSEPLLCALDADPPVSVTCISPMRKIAEDQPEVAAAPLTPHQIRLEEALLNTPGLTLTSVSEENASVCRELTDRPIGVTWLGVEDRRARHPRRRADDDAVEVLFVGRQEPRKGLDTLLEAAPGLLRDQPNVRVRICGADNPYANGRPDLFPEWVRIHAPDVADRIIFDGDLSDSALFDAYANADVFCAPSRYESFGLVHVEAMMMGLPVVAGDAGGMRETVVTGETGILVPPGEPEGLRAALDRLVGDTELRARMGVAGRERYEREFSVPVWVARQVDLFTRMVSRSSTEVPPPKALTALVSELCELDRADGEAAAAVLLDPLRYPYDPEQEIREALACPDDGDFVDRVYKSLLGRLPEPDGRAGCLSRLSIEPRASIVKDVALSDEAVARGVLPGLLGRLPETDPGTATRELVAAGFLAGDVAFVDQLARIVGFDAKTDWAQRLASGASRSDVAREALATPQARRRIALPDRVRVEDVHTDEEIVATLRRARDDREFVEALYVALLDRAPDESGLAGYERVLRSGVPRAIVAAEVAGSAEAAGRGVPGDLRYRLARGLSRPSRSLRPTRRRRSVRSPAFQPEARLTRVIERIADHSALEARLAELASTIRQERHAHEMERAELQSQLRATRQDAEVVARKYEALALDLRDRLPPRAATLLGGGDGDPSGVEIAWVGELRLNVGCGEKPLPGYVNVDFRPLPGVDVVADASNLPFPRGGVSELASFHLIEHFREHYVATVLLPHWRSLLRPEGVLRLVTPNWEVLVEQLRTGVRTWREFKTVTFGLQDYSGDDHFALYTPATLTELLESAGFEQITILAERRQNGLSPEIELLARPSP